MPGVLFQPAQGRQNPIDNWLGQPLDVTLRRSFDEDCIQGSATRSAADLRLKVAQSKGLSFGALGSLNESVVYRVVK